MEHFINILWKIDYPLTLIVSFVIFLLPLRKRHRLWIYFSLFAVALFGVWIVRSYIPDIQNNVGLTILFYILEISVLFGLIYFTLDVKLSSALVVLLCAVSTQHLAFKLSMQLLIFIDISLFNSAYYFLTSYLMLMVFAIFIYFVFARRLVEYIDYANIYFDMVVLALVILIEIVLSIYQQNIMFMEHENRVLIASIMNISNIILTAFILFILYVSTVYQKRKEESLVLSAMSQKERERFELAKITIDEINIKYHDLCHMMQDNEKNINDEDLKEIKQTVTNYKAIIHTSNTGLNVVIYEAQLKCINLGINLNVLVDGDSLAGFKNHHIYSLFSNLLTNSIEAVENIEDKDQRRIFLSIKRVRDSIVISIENPIKEAVSLKNGMPLTNKKDTVKHGFGLKSVKHIIDIYNGAFSLETKNNKFVVTIIFPKQDITT